MNFDKIAAELIIANKELAFQKEETEKRTAELSIANNEFNKLLTESKKSEKELFKRVQESTTMLDNNPDIIGRFDKKFRYIYINHPINTGNERLATELVGKTIYERGFTEEIVTQYERALDYVFASGKEKVLEVAYNNNGNIRYYESRCVPEFAQDGSIATALCISRDITEQKYSKDKIILLNKELAFQNEKNEKCVAELMIANKFLLDKEAKIKNLAESMEQWTIKDITERKKMETEIEERVAKLAVANKELEQFTYLTSHDLREPLLTIRNFTELILTEHSEDLNDEAKIQFQLVSKAAIRMDDLIKGLLDYSRLSSPKQMNDGVDCNEIVKVVLADLDFLVTKNMAIIIVEQLPIIKAYPLELKLLFVNLISNAIKFRKKETVPEIHISSTKIDKGWQFAIKDNGIGIEEKYKEKIFLIFQRLQKREKYEGTGIGLANCKKISEQHGGSIWVESIPGQSSTFYFTILTE